MTGKAILIQLAERELLHRACLLGDTLIHPDKRGGLTPESWHEDIATAYAALEAAREMPSGNTNIHGITGGPIVRLNIPDIEDARK
jgi:hypothetical protein